MDETTLRTLLEGALAGEPPLGPVADNALRAGVKARRRRVLSAAGSIAAAAVIAVTIPVVAGPSGAPPASRQHPASTLPFTGSANVPSPDKGVLRWPMLARDRSSIVKIRVETACNQIIVASGFVISPQHVLTNAHVVAGMTRLHVSYGSPKVLAAKLVLFDSNTDVAILYVPQLKAPPLRFAGPAVRGSDAVVAGYPPGGGLRVAPARIGSQWSAQQPNIYQTGTVRRAIYMVRVRAPNVGGPLVAKSGKVYGVIFAGSTTARDTWFALTASAVGPDVRRGARATTPVSTQGCPPIRPQPSPTP